jgi:hypothetical protein
MPHCRARKAAATPRGQGAQSSSGCPRRLLDRAGSPRPHPRPRQRPRDPPRVIVGIAGADGRSRHRVGRPGARPAGVPGNPPEPRDIRGATLWGGPGGTNRATMRSAVLTLAPPLISCLHERTTPQPCDDGSSRPRCCTPAGNRWYPKRGKPGALAQLEEHLLCKQRVRGSSPLSSTRQNDGFTGRGGPYSRIVQLHHWSAGCELPWRRVARNAPGDRSGRPT